MSPLRHPLLGLCLFLLLLLLHHHGPSRVARVAAFSGVVSVWPNPDLTLRSRWCWSFKTTTTTWSSVHRFGDVGVDAKDRFRRRGGHDKGLRSMIVLTAAPDPSTSSSPALMNKKNGRKKGRRATTSKQQPPGRTRSKTAGPSTTSSGRNSAAAAATWWRVFGVEVHPDRLADPPDNNSNDQPQPSSSSSTLLHPAIVQALEARLQISLTPNTTHNNSIRLVRQSLDARRRGRGSSGRRADGGTGPRFVYVLDVLLRNSNDPDSPWRRWKHQPGRLERLEEESEPPPLPSPSSRDPESLVGADPEHRVGTTSATTTTRPLIRRRVIIVGAGPAGLFCALELLKHNSSVIPILLERGQPVEVRGRDIGALMHRRQMNGESNYAFGEGGAGTWSDGKLTTRIGRNSDSVRQVLETLVEYGAPQHILWEGAPHLGTDNLVRLLRRMRHDLRRRGGEIHFGTRVTGLRITEDGVVQGVDYETTTSTTAAAVASRNAIDKMPVENPTTNTHPNDERQPQPSSLSSGTIYGDAVVLATGHSARDVYEQLHAAGVQLEAKGFAVGFRVEHPQKIINQLQYGTEWGSSVVTGKTTTDKLNQEYLKSFGGWSGDALHRQQQLQQHKGTLPVPSYRLATDKAYDGAQSRGAYSFCMCPGGQIVPASTDPNEVCVNGMSFSRRDSQWANSALVVTVTPDDVVLEPYRKDHGVLAGVAFQRDMERRAAVMGGGGNNMTVPVQRLTDFLEGRSSITAPPSSYRLGIRPAACHEIYPAPLVNALRNALTEHFNRTLPGFVCPEGLLHGVETRTSSPVRVVRNPDTLEAPGCRLLFPAGEGAGFAGGIVSAAVDGMVVAEAVLACLGGNDGETNAALDRENRRHSGGVGMMY